MYLDHVQCSAFYHVRTSRGTPLSFEKFFDDVFLKLIASDEVEKRY